jgi:hypothetical protein
MNKDLESLIRLAKEFDRLYWTTPLIGVSIGSTCDPTIHFEFSEWNTIFSDLDQFQSCTRESSELPYEIYRYIDNVKVYCVVSHNEYEEFLVLQREIKKKSTMHDLDMLINNLPEGRADEFMDRFIELVEEYGAECVGKLAIHNTDEENNDEPQGFEELP